MKKINTLIALLVFASLVIFMGCGKDNGGGKTEGEKDIEALTESTWTIDATNSSTDADGITIADIAINISGSSTITVGLSGGGIDTYVTSGGSFDVSDEGTISNVVLTNAGEDVEVGSASASLSSDNTTLTITFNTVESGSRVGGLGNFELVFKAS